MSLIIKYFYSNRYSQKDQEKWRKEAYQLPYSNKNYHNNYKQTHVYYSYNVYGCSIHDIITYFKYYLINAIFYFKDFSKRAISSFRGLNLSSTISNKNRVNTLACSSGIPVARTLSYKLSNSIEFIICYPHGKYCFKKTETIYPTIGTANNIITEIIKLTFVDNEDVEALTSSLIVSFKTDSKREISALILDSTRETSDLRQDSAELILFSSLSSTLIKSSLKDFASSLKSSFVAKELSHVLAFSTAIIYAPLRLFSYIPTIIPRICNRSIPKFKIMTHTRLMDMQGAHGWH